MSKQCKAAQQEKNMIISSRNAYIELYPDAPFDSKRYICNRKKASRRHSVWMMGREPWNKDLTKETDERVRRKAERQVGRPLSKQHRESMRKARIGVKLSEEHKQSISKGNTGRSVSKETCKKISDSLMGHFVSDETRRKISRRLSSIKLPDYRIRQIQEGRKRWWNNLSEEDKRKYLLNSLFKTGRSPNLSESVLVPVLGSLGFKYTGSDPPNEVNRRPDFTHQERPIIIEFDGWAGHNPGSRFTPDTWEECLAKDDQRDADYRSIGYGVLRLFSEDLKKGSLHIREKVNGWMERVG